MFSQPPPPFDDDVDDQTVLPIDSNLIGLCVLGVALGYYVVKKNELIKITKR